jgi:histidinol phosphatase-like enzyme (inositol monophosphatase family)
MTSLMEAVADVARMVSNNALLYYRKKIDVDIKSDGSPVTIADRTSEEKARAWIAQKFPADGILGEEFGKTKPDAKRQWIIDPIDGTKAFVRGVPLWGSLVAVVEDDQVIAGASCFGALDEILAAAPGEGCWLNGSRCTVSSVSDIADATVLTTDIGFKGYRDKRDAWLRLADGAAIARTWSDCYGYLLVATGRAEVMADPVISLWDIAALIPAIAEAGGVFTDWEGNVSMSGKSAVATNAALASRAREILRGEK